MGCADTGVLTLTLNRPEQRNALSVGLLESLREQLVSLRDDAGSTYRAVVVQANGPAFCAGHDLKEIIDPANADEDSHRQLFELCSEVMMLVETIPQPVIAAVHGIATAAGCQLVAATDLAVSAPSCRFATPGVSIGLFCSTPAVPLVRCVGKKAAMDMLLTGRLVPADEAKRIGLVSHVAAAHPDDAQAEAVAAQFEAHQLAQAIASRSGSALGIGKQTLAAQIGAPLDKAYALASEAMTRNMATEDAAEGISAFLDKRHPSWRHR
ncbi:Enoyl-CoA hydratase domain-containing protein 3 [Durusdinium trenchii]|uniref:Enoyl-CoA hydratase domain-containing protein 3, mitochondrial n=1 Tax=Durusdinium trenchii TaxID=1381693 RepID=A0ABP0KL46_9DINO